MINFSGVDKAKIEFYVARDKHRNNIHHDKKWNSDFTGGTTKDHGGDKRYRNDKESTGQFYRGGISKAFSL